MPIIFSKPFPTVSDSVPNPDSQVHARVLSSALVGKSVYAAFALPLNASDVSVTATLWARSGVSGWAVVGTSAILPGQNVLMVSYATAPSGTEQSYWLQLSGGGTVAGENVSLSVETTGAPVQPLRIATDQLSAAAGILGSQLSATAGIVGTQLSATAGITGSQLAANAQIAATQLATSVQAQLTALSVPRWIDLQGDITQGTASAALTYEAYRDTAHQMFWFINDQTDQIYMRYQMPHGFVIGSQVRPHVHVLPVSTIGADQNVRMTLAYAWGETGNAIPANTGWVSADYDLPVAVAGQYIPHRLNGPLITAPAWVTGSSYLLCTWTNKVGDAAYTYKTNKSGGTVKANLGLLGADCHVQVGGLGSVNETP